MTLHTTAEVCLIVCVLCLCACVCVLAALVCMQQATRESFALALAELATSARSGNSSSCLAAALEAEKKPAKRQQLERVAGGMFKAALVAPFVEAAVAGHKVSQGCGAAGTSVAASSFGLE